MILTPHFGKKEFASKDGAGMPEEVWQNIRILATQAEIIREALGNKPMNVLSGFRSEAHNTKVGGKKNSQHLLGKAFDISVPGVSPKKVADTIEKLIKDKKILQGGVGRYDTFTHYDIRGEKARWDNTTKSSE